MTRDTIKMLAGLRIARTRTGMQQKELAAMVGVDKCHLSSIENCKKAPSWKLVCSLADALGVTVNDLLEVA